jgi:GAF domain-containing protein
VLGFVFLLIGQREQHLREANLQLEHALQAAQTMRESLEMRVADRTRELERQSLRVRTAAEIARDVASVSDLDELLARASELIVGRFNFYHAGIFLLDENKEFAVLRASPTEAGRQLIANSHRLRVGEQGIVGRVAATGESRIALDTGTDAVYFDNPFLPATRSEVGLPLKTGHEIFGVLDIQSQQPRAFTSEDIESLQVMADQLAIAIERARLLQKTESQLQEVEQAYREFTRTAWTGLMDDENRTAGYKFDGMQLQPLGVALRGAEQAGGPADAPDGPDVQAVPIRLRGQTIGSVRIRLREGSTPEKTMAIVEQIADRLAAALENARLAEETRRRVRRDELVNELSSSFRSTLDLGSVLRTAAQEFQRTFQLEQAEVRLGFPAAEAERAAHSAARKNGSSQERGH